MTTGRGLEVHEGGKVLNIKPGIYPGAVNAIEEVDEDYGPQWRFEFRLDDHPEELPWAWATANAGTLTKLYAWATVLLGRPLAIGEHITTDQLVDCRCNILIKDKLNKRGEMRRGVDDLLPLDTTPKQQKPLEAAPLADKCYCGKPVSSYTANGTPLCEKHTAEAMQE